MDFQGKKTYAWVTAMQPKTGNPVVDNNATLNTAVRDDINNALSKRGYVLATADSKPDFLIAYRATLDKDVNIQSGDYSAGYNPYYAYGEGTQRPSGTPEDAGRMPAVNSFEQGTLVIDVVDPTTKQLVWRVTGTDTVNLKNSPERKRKNLRRAIDEMLDKFPPKTAP